MGFLAWIVLGLIAGAIAKMIMGDGGNWVTSILLGIVGAIVGGYIAGQFFGVALGNLGDFRTWIIAILGSCLVLFVYNILARRK